VDFQIHETSGARRAHFCSGENLGCHAPLLTRIGELGTGVSKLGGGLLQAFLSDLIDL
jgi:hypothetical protein